MARIRSVHPSMFTDEAVVSCSPLARYLYVGLWTDADDQGLFEWKPLQIRMRVLPGDNADMRELLEELVAAELISPLESGGKKLGAIKYFRRFQRPKKPNSVFVLPTEWRTYVGLSDDGSPPEPDEDDEVPPKGEIPPQMEDGGWRGGCREVEKATAFSLSPGAQARRERAKPKVSIPEGYPDAEALGEARRLIDASGAALVAATLAERFRNHARSEGRRSADWPAAWANWVGVEIGRAPRSPNRTVEGLPDFAGPDRIRDAVIAGMGRERGLAHLARSRWLDLPEPTLIAPTETYAKALRGEAGAELGGAGAPRVLSEKAFADAERTAA